MTDPVAPLLERALRVVRGYHRHAQIMVAVHNEQRTLLAQGRIELDPLDGFPSTAAAVAINWRDRVIDDIRELYEVDLINTLVSTVIETGRYYSEADLSWSKVWTAYANEHYNWLCEVRATAVFAGEDRSAFASLLVPLKKLII
ncbi:MAG: hypothetical protein ACYDGM_05535 [Vulcanimicrobiaceae bacterium]